MLVESVMTRTLVTTEPSRSVQSAARVMREGRFRHLPVLQHGHLVGIVSDRDVTASGKRTIADVMRPGVITVGPDTPVEIAARLMVDNKIGALLVVENAGDEPAGIVTQSDLFQVLARLLGGDGPSTRLELLLTDLPRQLAQTVALADQQHVPITSLVTLPAGNRERSRRVVVRIGTIAAAPFANALRAIGIDIAMAEQPDVRAPADG
jgi:acetoin utilization protein AcuB